jgi:predicted dehydrogenase
MAKAGRPVIRYAVVGLGHIAQVAVLPAFKHARRNSRLVALVTDDRLKARQLAARYGVEGAYSYDDFEECLKTVDAVYIALPNSMHAEFTTRAARAGVHVLCEKPLAVTVPECRKMIAACRRNRVKLMTAYRLHFDQATLEVVDLVRKGRIGTPKYFNSSFSMTVREGNIRTKPEMGGGTLYDIGVYCINAARAIFRGEPKDVMAISVNSGAERTRRIDESTGAIMRFDKERVAAFVTSFNAADAGSYTVVGTKGSIRVDPAYEYAEGLSYTITVGEKTKRVRRPKRDQFAPELLYFSDCILRNREPEPSGVEGLQDVQIVQALYRSARSRRAVKVPRIRMDKAPTKRQIIRRPAIRKPQVINAKSATVE